MGFKKFNSCSNMNNSGNATINSTIIVISKYLFNYKHLDLQYIYSTFPQTNFDFAIFALVTFTENCFQNRILVMLFLLPLQNSVCVTVQWTFQQNILFHCFQTISAQLGLSITANETASIIHKFTCIQNPVAIC